MTSTTLICSGLFALLGCSSSPTVEGKAVQGGSKPASGSASSALTKPTTETVTVRDPVENCFTVNVPKGWYNQAYVTRQYDIHREVVTCVSPNSDTVLFMGDPSIPQYWSPSHANEMTYRFAAVNPMMKIQPAQSAQTYFTSYAQRKFGKLPGYKLTGITDDPKIKSDMDKYLAKHGLQANCSAVNIRFTYEDKGKKSSALIIGFVMDFGSFWMADVNGISTLGNPDDFRPMLIALTATKKTNPEWTAKQQQLHQQRMAQIEAHGRMMTDRHNQNMAWIQQSAQRHQAKMEGIWAAGDASVRNFYERSAASDGQHQRFLNYINDEHTVTSSGKAFQVDHSYQRYFIKKGTNNYLGGDINFDSEAIRRMGLNPDDYEEAQIRK